MHNCHDCAVITGDSFIASYLPLQLQWLVNTFVQHYTLLVCCYVVSMHLYKLVITQLCVHELNGTPAEHVCLYIDVPWCLGQVDII